MSIRLRLVFTALLGLCICAIVVPLRLRAGRHDEQQLQQANKAHQVADTAKTQGDAYVQQAQNLNPTIKADGDALAAARARRNRDRAALLAAHDRPAPGAPADPKPAGDPQSVVPPVDGAALVADDVAVDAAADAKMAHLEEQVRLLTLADQQHQAEASALREENRLLRANIAARPTSRPWGVGAVYGTNQTVGGYISKDLSLVQVGAQVVRRQIPGGQSTLEAIFTAGVRF